MSDENTPTTHEKSTAPEVTPAAPSEATHTESTHSVAPAPPPADELLATAADEHAARVAPETPTEPQPAEPPAELHEPAPPAHADSHSAAEAHTAETHTAEPPVEPEDAEAEPEPELEAPTASTEPTEPAAEAEPKPKKSRKAKTATADDADATDGAATEPTAAPAASGTVPDPESKKKWYVVKVQSGREESIKAAIERKIKIEGLDGYFGQIVIPVEEVVVKKKVQVKNKKTGEKTTQEKNVTKHNKKFPGYLFTEVEFNDEILYVFRETSGVGDFVGIPAKRDPKTGERAAPAPMTDQEVLSMLTGVSTGRRKAGQPAKTVVKLDFEKGDKVRIRNGPFAGNEGEVKLITEAKDPTDTPKVTVVVTLWGRPVDVDMDYWEVDKV